MFENPESAKQFILAGNAVFTLTSQKSGVSFTYRVKQGEGNSPHFVSVLTGSNNEEDYTFLGTVFEGSTYRHGKKSPLQQSAPSAKAFEWFWKHLNQGESPAHCEMRHVGRCGRCGRPLTVPTSIDSGFGPECLRRASQ
jgi:hypothetical protein